jgi:2-polyprenyl-3-methyl-5-hydroxy-6-metoxy-1,4-benzoquinol methylase
MNIFNDTRQLFKAEISNVLKLQNSYAIAEAALPAYAHKNPIIDYIFWSRVKTAYNYAKQNVEPNGKILDFGCGTGLLTYALAKNGFKVTGSDVEFAPLDLMKQRIDYPEEINFIKGDLLFQSIPKSSFDLIIALDVLEHVSNLDDYISLFKSILKPNGVIVVSGPTESKLYKLGRKLAGKQFSGEYHVSNIDFIKNKFSKQMPVKVIKRLIWPFTLFELFVATNT